MAVVLVTGGAGYIGSHVCKALAEAGHTPVAYDNMVMGHRWAVRWGPLEEGDIADRQRLNTVLSRYQPRAVLHLAAFAYVGESMANPGKYYRNNVSGSLTLLEAMRDHQIDSLIFSSSCATYGNPEYTPIDEAHPQRPINPYGASKLMVERMIRDFAQAHDLRYVALRYFNAAGADDGGEIGEWHDPETHLVPLALRAANGEAPYLSIFGTDYPTPDGTAIRDYVHVTDLALAHVLAMNYLDQGGLSTEINLGTGLGYSVRQVIGAVQAVTGLTVPCRELPRRAGDPAVLVAAPRRARELLGWEPVHSGIHNIVSTAWRWHLRALDQMR